MFVESRKRTLYKVLSWRVWATITTTLLTFLFTRRVEIALGVGAADVLLKLVFYYWHERVWNKIAWGRQSVKPAVLWLTGLPSSGKTTIAEYTAAELSKRGYRVEHLDGKDIRRIFPELGFSDIERDVHSRRVGHLASMLEKNGVFVIVSIVSPLAASRDFVRQICKDFVEIHVSTPVLVCQERDKTGLYALAAKGKLPGFTGIDGPYEAPQNPELTIDAARLAPAESASIIVRYLEPRLNEWQNE